MILQNYCRTSLNILTLNSPDITTSLTHSDSDVKFSTDRFFGLRISCNSFKSYGNILSPSSSLKCKNSSSEFECYNAVSHSNHAPILRYGAFSGEGIVPISQKNHKVKNVCFKISANSLNQVGLGQKELKEDKEEEDKEDEEDEEDEYEEGEVEGEGETESIRRIATKPRRFPLLGNKEKKELRAFAHQLGKKLKMQQVGKWGVTPTLATAISDTLEANEILKMKILESCPEDVQEVSWKLEDLTEAQVIGKVGRTILLYRPSVTKMEEAREARLRAEKSKGEYQRRSGGGGRGGGGRGGFSSRGGGRSRRD